MSTSVGRRIPTHVGQKNNEAPFGYKDYLKVDTDSEIITKYAVTSTNVHDSQKFTYFSDDTNATIYADSAYVGQAVPTQVCAEIAKKDTELTR